MEATTRSQRNKNEGSTSSNNNIPPREQKKHNHYRLREPHRRAFSEDGVDEDHEWSGSAQGATNCDDCEYTPDILFEDKYPVEYSCSEVIDEENDPTSSTLLQFDYEASLPLGMNIEANVRALEWSFLEAAAKRLGLNPRCNLDKQYEEDNGRELQMTEHGSQRKLSTLSYPVAVYSINRNPSDTSVDGCKTLKYDSTKMQCLAITAQMQVHFRGSTTDSLDVEEFLRGIFEERMEADPKSLRAGYVDDLAYVGDRDAATPMSSEAATAQTNEIDASNSSAMLPALISVSSIVLLGGLFFLFRSKRRRSQENSEMKQVRDYIPDLETGSTATSDTFWATKSKMSESPSSTAEKSQSEDCAEGIMTDTIAEDTEQQPPQPSRPPQFSLHEKVLSTVDPGVPRVRSQDSTDGVLSTAAVVAGGHPLDALPPRPPRRNSMKLKKRRKRRKKKKKVTLQRVNSRENIKEMDTIVESADEESEYTYESGSEYSSDDDGSSNFSSSGCLTPIRNRSLPNSRASSRQSSPKLSPQDELFPSDVFSSDFEFFIEAPDFPYSTNDKKKSTLKPRPSNKPDNINKVSTIKEEKIKPLPPPWF